MIYTLHLCLIFYEEKNNHPFNDFEELDSIRKQLKTTLQLLRLQTLGQVQKLHSNKRVINQIAKHGIAQKTKQNFIPFIK